MRIASGLLRYEVLFSDATSSLPFIPFLPRHKHLFIFELLHVNHYSVLYDCTSREFSGNYSIAFFENIS